MYSHNAPGQYNYVVDGQLASSGRQTPLQGGGGYSYYQPNRTVSPAPQNMSQQYGVVQQRDPARATNSSSSGGATGGFWSAQHSMMGTGGYSPGKWRVPHNFCVQSKVSSHALLVWTCILAGAP